MLPGIRILFATFVLSASVLIFGLGAAALLRSAHEEFVGIPAWRAAQQPMAPASNTGQPTLAFLRVDPPLSKKVEIAKAESPKTVSIDAEATTDVKAVPSQTEEISTPDEVRRPRMRRAKHVRNIRHARNVKLIRHWSARAPQTIQPLATNNSPFGGLDAADQTASSGTGRNRRTVTNSPL